MAVVGLWAFVFLLDSLAFPPAFAGAILSGYWAALVVSRVLLGATAERVGTWPVLAAATVLIVTAAVLVVSQQSAPAAVGIVLLGLASGPSTRCWFLPPMNGRRPPPTTVSSASRPPHPPWVRSPVLSP